MWAPLAISAAGTVLGFPLGLALALREVPAAHAAVVTGVLPLATAVVGALAGRQRPSAGFWTAAVAGCALVLAFAAWQGGGMLVAADGWLALAVVAAALGYVAGARAGAVLPAPQVISWVLVGALPFTLPVALLLWPAAPASAAAGAAFSTPPCSPCGWASSPGTAAWRWAACCASARCSFCSPSWR